MPINLCKDNNFEIKNTIAAFFFLQIFFAPAFTVLPEQEQNRWAATLLCKPVSMHLLAYKFGFRGRELRQFYG